MPGRPSKKDAVFRAAKSAFIRFGFEHASMDDIAGQAGATKATVYAHAKSKEELFRLVISEAIRLSTDKMLPLSPESPVAESLEAYLNRYLEIACWEGSIGLQRTAIASQRQFPDLSRNIMDQVVFLAHEEIAGFIKHACEDQDPLATARILLSAATADRHMSTLFGARAPLRNKPGNNTDDPSLPDDVVRRTVREFCSANQIG